MDTRLQSVKTKVGEHRYDTKPIWERALSEILEVKNGVGAVKQELVDVKNDLTVVQHELGHVKHELALINRRFRYSVTTC